ncbi:DUF427 domain-containing protein [soil metagenome]
MPKAYWNGALIAESDDTLLVDGYCYFPVEHVREECLRPSQTRATTADKGEARYFHVLVGRELNADAAWTYPEPAPGFRELAGRIAFWHGVEVE